MSGLIDFVTIGKDLLSR